ncbi:MAG: ATP synthase F0 subunit B [Candidatus Zixiibacteriota bacterium]|nr:MAG: ATP synthase F0 subunit B [candidate division Zixibacteria bacterium]
MQLVTPDFGLLFWMLVSFLIFIFLLKKYAWKPILKSIKERDESIEHALKAAEEARAEIEEIKKESERIRRDVLIEREGIIDKAVHEKDRIVEAAKHQAKAEADKIFQETKQDIEHEKKQAIIELKNQVATVSIQIAEKVLRKEMANKKDQEKYINDLLKEINLN